MPIADTLQILRHPLFWGRALIVIIALALDLIMALTAYGDTPRTIGWDTLVPRHEPLADPLAAQPMAVRFDLGFAAKVLGDARTGLISDTGPEYQNALALLERLRSTGVDVDPLLASVAARDDAIEARKFSVDAALDGELVRLPGYALPLRVSETGVSDFLLVPYVGACIHYPPPPANQIVLAKLPRAHVFKDRYEMIWITGRLSARAASQALDYVDGQATVATAYTMDVISIEPYGSDPTAQTFAGSFSPSAAGPQLRLSRSSQPHDGSIPVPTAIPVR